MSKDTTESTSDSGKKVSCRRTNPTAVCPVAAPIKSGHEVHVNLMAAFGGRVVGIVPCERRAV